MAAFLIASDIAHPRRLRRVARALERPGRPSLSCVLIEPLRVPAVDRWAVNVCNQAELTPDVFRSEENRGFRLQPKWFGRTLYSWETSG